MTLTISSFTKFGESIKPFSSVAMCAMGTDSRILRSEFESYTQYKVFVWTTVSYLIFFFSSLLALVCAIGYGKAISIKTNLQFPNIFYYFSILTKKDINLVGNLFLIRSLPYFKLLDFANCNYDILFNECIVSRFQIYIFFFHLI